MFNHYFRKPIFTALNCIIIHVHAQQILANQIIMHLYGKFTLGNTSKSSLVYQLMPFRIQHFRATYFRSPLARSTSLLARLVYTISPPPARTVSSTTKPASYIHQDLVQARCYLKIYAKVISNIHLILNPEDGVRKLRGLVYFGTTRCRKSAILFF